MENNTYYIVRAKDAGVFFGKIKERAGMESVTMTEVRKLWYWDGACAVEQLAIAGTSMPDTCKFTITVPEMMIAAPIQIIPCTEKAIKIIQGVREWKN